MYNLTIIEQCYKKFIKNLYFWIPEDVYFINLELLHKMNLLHFQPQSSKAQSILTYYFHVLESTDKITLMNEEFIIWMIPIQNENISLNYTLIALNLPEQDPKLKMAFIASGVYNTSDLILKLLEKFLIEIRENEAATKNLA